MWKSKREWLYLTAWGFKMFPEHVAPINIYVVAINVLFYEDINTC